MKNATEDEVVAIATAYCIDMSRPQVQGTSACWHCATLMDTLSKPSLHCMWNYGLHHMYVANSPLRPFVLHEY